MTLKVTGSTGGGGADPKTEGTGSVDANGKVTVVAPEGAGKGSGKAAERPAWLPEGYDTPEAFRAAWDTHGAPAAKAAAEQATKANETKVETGAAAAKVDLPSLEKEWNDNGGKLTDKTLASLTEKGITSDMVEEFVTARKASVSAYEASLEKHVGGKEKLTQLMDWASKNFTDAQVESFNKAVSNMKDSAGALEALDVLQMRYERANGKSGMSVTASSENVTPSGIQPIADMNELKDLQKDPKYKRGDKAFHKMVDDRLKASPHLFR